MASLSLADPDLWGHVRFGMDILRDRAIASIDPYSYVTQSARWINHEWLSESLYGWAFQQFSVAGLIMVKAVMVWSIGAGTYWWLIRAGVPLLTTGGVTLITMGLLGAGAVSIRPQIFTYLGMFLLIATLRASNKRPLLLALVPVIIAVWTNAHGGFLAGLCVLFAYCVLESVQNRQRALPLISTAVAGLLASLLNPYGVQLLAFLLETATVPRPEIWEWHPLTLVSWPGLFYFSMVLVSGAALLKSPKAKRWAECFVWFALAMAPQVSARHAPLFAVAPLLVSEHIAAVASQYSTGRLFHPNILKMLAAISVIGSLVLIVMTMPNLSRIPVLDYYPANAAKALKDSGASGNAATFFGWGEYLIWHLGPRVKVSIDGRRETVYPLKEYLENMTFTDGIGDWDALIRNHKTDFVVIEKNSAPYNLMKLHKGWKLAYEDDRTAIFLPLDSKTNIPAPQVTAEEAPLSFP